jgi:hypothetical protein
MPTGPHPRECFPISTGPHSRRSAFQSRPGHIPKSAFQSRPVGTPEGTLSNLDRATLQWKHFPISTGPYPRRNTFQSRPVRIPEGTLSNLDQATLQWKRFPISTGPHPRRNAFQSRPVRIPEGTLSNHWTLCKTSFPLNHPPLPKQQRTFLQPAGSSRNKRGCPSSQASVPRKSLRACLVQSGRSLHVPDLLLATPRLRTRTGSPS